MTEWQTVLELVLIGLLAVMVYYLMRLERAFRAIDKDRAKFDASLQDVSHNTQRAENGLAKLRETAETITQAITKELTSGRELEEDLIGLLHRGSDLANRLENLTRSELRAETSRSETVVHDPQALDARPRNVRSKAERDLLRVLRAPR